MASNKRYYVESVRDDPARLSDMLAQIGERGDRVINVIWQPEREVPVAETRRHYLSGYKIVVEGD